ncbi:MAG: hypothetical protein Q8S73_33705 [Deltaproteobacteria bacterium]|nr:hypothetical protein [Deltaproteobacteria bacterium]
MHFVTESRPVGHPRGMASAAHTPLPSGRVTWRVALLLPLLGACGGELPAGTDDGAPPSLDAPADAASPRDASPDASVAPADRSEVDAEAAPSCEAAADLDAPGNATAAGVYVLRNAMAQRYATPQGCYWQPGYAITARFTSATAARWRFGARGEGLSHLSVHDGCRGAATGERLRCVSERTAPASPLDGTSLSADVTLAAGRSVTLVINCPDDGAPCVADLFAQQIQDRGCFEADTPCAAGLACVWTDERGPAMGRCVPGTAPRLTDVHVYSVGVVTAGAHDVDRDHREVFAELLDARGEITPLRGNPRLDGVVEDRGVLTELRWVVGRGYPMPDDAVRARVWLRDGAGLESPRVEVPVEAPTELPAGAPCVTPTDDRLTRITACAPGTRCLGDATGARCLTQTPPTLTRVAAWHSAEERELAVDVEAIDPDHDLSYAEIVFLDGAGDELRGTSFEPYSRGRRLATRRDATVGIDEQSTPPGLARIRLRVGDAFGLWSPWTELTPTPSTTVEPGAHCDPGSRARMRCEPSRASCVPRVGEARGRCDAHETTCPRYWSAARWTLPPGAATHAVTVGATSWSSPRVTCLSARDRVGAEYEIVAPVTGTYRFELAGRTGGSGYALALRAACGGPDETAELACRAADPSAGRAVLERALTAGERVMLVASASASLEGARLAVTVP